MFLANLVGSLLHRGGSWRLVFPPSSSSLVLFLLENIWFSLPLSSPVITLQHYSFMDSERCKGENWEQNVISVLVNPALECESEEEDSDIQSSSGIFEPTDRKEENEIETERKSNLSESGSEKQISLTYQSKKDPSNTKLELIKQSKDKGSIELVECGKVRKKSSSKISRKMSQSSVEQTGILDRVFNSTQSRDLKETFSLKLPGLSGTKDLDQEVTGTMAEENGVGLFIKKCVRKKSWSLRALPGECIFSMKDHSGQSETTLKGLLTYSLVSFHFKNYLSDSQRYQLNIFVWNYNGGYVLVLFFKNNHFHL